MDVYRMGNAILMSRELKLKRIIIFAKILAYAFGDGTITIANVEKKMAADAPV